jgi:hypothetical protein
MPRARRPALDDLQSQQYGQTAALQAQQQGTPEAAPFVGPDEVPNLSAPSSRPGEPVTAGLPVGAGPGPEVLSPMGDPVRRTLQAILLSNPENHDVMRLLDLLDAMGR